MWATDFPWIYKTPGYDKLTQLIKKTLPDINIQDYNLIMGETAQKFLRFPDLN